MACTNKFPATMWNLLLHRNHDGPWAISEIIWRPTSCGARETELVIMAHCYPSRGILRLKDRLNVGLSSRLLQQLQYREFLLVVSMGSSPVYDRHRPSPVAST